MSNTTKKPGTVLEAHYQFLLWMIPTLSHFPKTQRFLLGDQIQTIGIEIMKNLIAATFDRNRSGYLQTANIDVEKLRFLFRLSNDLEYLDHRRYEYAARSLDEIGRLIGGWRRAHNAQTAPEA